MFVRIAWRDRASASQPGPRRRVRLAGRREADDLGVPPRDFAKMTKGLFDRRD